MICKWEELPPKMQNDSVLPYYKILKEKNVSLFFVRVFDIVVSFLMLVVLSPIFLVLAVAIKLDTKGPVFFRQVRITQYGKEFKIHKFRSMVNDASKGAAVTANNDSRVTRVGRFIRKYRLDEICQLIDVLNGNMTFVGTRPEVPKYTVSYTEEMFATLLLPAGVTSEASIFFKDESELLNDSENIDGDYIEKVLPQKMLYNISALKKFGFWYTIKIMIMTVLAVLGKEYKPEHIIIEKEKEEATV